MPADLPLPSRDGQLIMYFYRGSAPRSPLVLEPLLYVNGMNTSPHDHAAAAQGFADLTRHDVLGCYNLKGSYATNLADTLARRLLAGIREVRREAASRMNATAQNLTSVGEALPWSMGPVKADMMFAGAVVKLDAAVADWLLNAIEVSVKAAQDYGVGLWSLLTDIDQCASDWTTPLKLDAIRMTAVRVEALERQEAEVARKLATSRTPVLDPTVRFESALLYDLLRIMCLPEPARTAAKYAFARELLVDNEASESLFNLLYDHRNRNVTIHIICHSQGNLIVSNALNLLFWVLGPQLRPSFHVFGLASPANPEAWPDVGPRLQLLIYQSGKDPVTWLSLADSPVAKVQPVHTANSLGLAAHKVELYAAAPEVATALRREFKILR